MKRIFLPFLFGAILSSCDRPTSTVTADSSDHAADDSIEAAKAEMEKISFNPATLFSDERAELIFGQPATLTDSSRSASALSDIYRCTYTAAAKDSKGKEGNLYFMFQEFNNVDSAKQSYASIKMSNEVHKGFEVITDLGNEAYFHSDDENFYFLMVRKGNRELRIKLKENFMKVGRAITEAM